MFNPNNKNQIRIGFIGAGIVGISLALALRKSDYNVRSIFSRRKKSSETFARLISGCHVVESYDEVSAKSDIVFITTSDDSIQAVASKTNWRSKQLVVHCSGASTLDVLEEARIQGAYVGSLHPLQAFASFEDGVLSIPGTTFAIEGKEFARSFLESLALDIGGEVIYLNSEDKVLYHLTGVMMGGMLSTLAASVSDLWRLFGYDREKGVNALSKMIHQVGINLRQLGIPDAVAGPYSRGDIGTIEKHLSGLLDKAPELLPVYCEMALIGLPYAFEKGNLSEEKLQEIRGLVLSFKNKGEFK